MTAYDEPQHDHSGMDQIADPVHPLEPVKPVPLTPADVGKLAELRATPNRDEAANEAMATLALRENIPAPIPPKVQATPEQMTVSTLGAIEALAALFEHAVAVIPALGGMWGQLRQLRAHIETMRPVAPLAVPAAPAFMGQPARTAPLTEGERNRLSSLRALIRLNGDQTAEMNALAAREHVPPVAPARASSLTAAEEQRFLALREMTSRDAAQTAEMNALDARSRSLPQNE